MELVPGVVTVIPMGEHYEEHTLNPPRAARQGRRRLAAEGAVNHEDSEVALPLGDQETEVEMEEDGDSDVIDIEEHNEVIEEDGVDEALLLRAEIMQEYASAGIQQQEAEPSRAQGQEVAMEAGGASSSSAGPVAPLEPEMAAVQASSSNADIPAAPPPPPPPPPPEQARARKGGPRAHVGMAEEEVRLPNGRIAFHQSKQSFEATCRVHVGCVLSRTKHGRKVRGMAEKQGGRPLGFLSLWLQKATEYESSALHKNKDLWATYSHEARSAARRDLGTITGAQRLLALEKPKANADDPDEPLDLLGME